LSIGRNFVAVLQGLFKYHPNGGQQTLPDRTTNQPIFQGVHAMKTINLITSALLLSASILSVAQAAAPSDAATAVVKFGELDVNSTAGKQELYLRLNQAARTVCRSLDPSESGAKYLPASRYKACIEQAVSGATAKIDRPDFSAYVASRMPKATGSVIQLAAR
jgi:UrcA family protein